MDCSPPGSSAHGSFQARILEWVAISFSQAELLMYFLYIILQLKKILLTGNSVVVQWLRLDAFTARDLSSITG